MIFYLQRLSPFICPDPQDWDSPLKKMLRGRLEQIACALEDSQRAPEYPKFIAAEQMSTKVMGQVDARCWLEAKELLGYPLTTLQDMQLDKTLIRGKRAKARFL